jgi:hypothetical protein
MYRCETLRATVVAALALFLVPHVAFAHGVTGRDAAFVQSIDGAAIGPFLYLGAKHMVTGYDHLAFLVGVIFFLYRLKDVLLYVSLFTLGHSATLLLGVLGGIHANAYIIDAIIGLSVAYKAFENMDGFERIGLRIEKRAVVMVFGLFQLLADATRISPLFVCDEYSLDDSGLHADRLSARWILSVVAGVGHVHD